MARYLIIANETVGGDDLVDEVRRHADPGTTFHVVVPATPTDDGGRGAGPPGGAHYSAGGLRGPAVAGGGPTSAGSFGDPSFSGEPGLTGTTSAPPADGADGGGDAVLSALDKAQILLDQVLGRLESVTGDVTGEIGQSDAIEAARDALAADNYNGVILATPPAGMSKIVGQDLPTRLGQAVEVPVTTVSGDPADPSVAD